MRGFWLSHILLCRLSPQGVGLQSSARVRQSPDRSITEKHGRHYEFSKLAVVRGNKRVERLLVKSQMVLLSLGLVSLSDIRDVSSSLPTTPYHPLSME